MFKRILVPIDLSKKNAPALATALDLARDHGGQVTLVHVIRAIPHLSREELKSFYQSLEERTRQVMDRHIARFVRAGVDAEGVIAYGDPTREILAVAKRARSDLIVVNSHRVSERPPFEDWGTLSHKLAVLAGCPVLLVK